MATRRHPSLFLPTLVLGLLLGTGCSDGSAPGAADLVLRGGRIVTVDGQETVAEALAIQGDTIVAVGSDAEVGRWVGEDTRVLELDGRTVVPGLADNHYHGIGGGPGVDLSTARSLDDVRRAIAARAADTPAREVIVTNSDWHEGQLQEQRLPYRDDLDRAAPDHPVVVVRGGHEYILNSRALERWGIDERTAAVNGGRIGRYEDGRLNGELVDRAKGLVELPDRPADDRDPAEALLAEHRQLHALGLTSIRYPGASVEQYELLRRLHDQGRLTMRVSFLFRAPRGGSAEEVDQAMEGWPAEPGEGDDRLRVWGVKEYVDGGFEGGWMREPYAEPWGEGGTYSGLQTADSAAYISAVRELHRRGWRVATHAVGDAGMDLVLAAYRAADEDSPIDDERWAVEHAFMGRPDQFPLFREMGIHISAQDHLYLAAPSLVEYWGRDRAERTTPLRDYLDAGIPVSLGTDSPVVPENPWWGLHHFTTRQTISAGVMGEDQKISRMEALRANTMGFARLTFDEDRKGSLEPGKLADLVVTSDDYLSCPDPCIENMEAELTMVGGQVVYSTLPSFTTAEQTSPPSQ
jgi:predicted amidohydrolase YtcJ